MPLGAIVLVLIAAGFHAAWNLRLHTSADRPATLAVAGLVAGIGLLPAVLVSPPFAVWPLVLLSAVAETAYAICLSAAYQRGALALAYPIGRGTAPLLVTVGGWFVLAERPAPARLLAALALAAG